MDGTRLGTPRSSNHIRKRPRTLSSSCLSSRSRPTFSISRSKFGKPNQTLNNTVWKTLQRAITKAVESTGFFYSQLGDPIDTITIVRELAVKYQSPEKKDEQLAVTDGLGRNFDGERWAAVGWIFGSEVRSIYQAMCAIFLDSQTAMLYDSYPKQGNWPNMKWRKQVAN